jgi:hypothetical protein
MKMSHFATNENVPFMPRKLVDNELAIRYASAPDGYFTSFIDIWASAWVSKGKRLVVNKEIGINGTFSKMIHTLIILLIITYLTKHSYTIIALTRN